MREAEGVTEVGSRRERREGVTNPVVTLPAVQKVIRKFEREHQWHMDAVNSWGVMCQEDCSECQRWAVIMTLAQVYYEWG